MGGAIAWTIRHADGSEERMQQRTNSLKRLAMNNAFLAGEPAAVQEATAHWHAWKADWEANRGTGEFTHANTPDYAPYPFGLRPSEYGLVVTDFRTKTILSCQDYTRLDRDHLSRTMRPDWHPGGLPPAIEALVLAEMDEEQRAWHVANKAKLLDDARREAERMRALLAAGRIVAVFEAATLVETPVAGLGFDEVLDLALGRDPGSPTDGTLGWVRLALPEVWRLREFSPDTPEGRAGVLEAIRGLGFALDEAEREAFGQWIAAARAEGCEAPGPA
ncbi:hypothetical protein LAZ40_01530 [Cereibacter sphaeroides]|uniref:hypothetical protein n=1 Tax=Cereibacter sphaeroides TaxID=1063 RepID=UPI001F181C42|nr:hypothetical protein [Cereibacter sphaeroides]MCE6957741.1 hypothetical protein [Cereibacter sphaeroides]MCE6971633.1 hypothetical protein [Cereibacter sphaeroides]